MSKPFKRWRSQTGLRLLAGLLRDERAAWDKAAELQVQEWECSLIQGVMYGRGRKRRRPPGWRPTNADIRRVAGELDILRGGNFDPDHLDRLEDTGFRGRRAHLVRFFALFDWARGWESWRRRSGEVPDLRGANLSDLDLRHVDLTDARLRGANLSAAVVRTGLLRRADLRDCRLDHTDLSYAQLERADLRGAVLRETLMTGASLVEADLRRAWLIGTYMNQVDLRGADLRRAIVWGVSTWDMNDEGARQEDLLLVPQLDPIDYDEKAVLEEGWGVRVDDLGTAHFVSMLVENPEIGDVINAAARRVVLLLGRFVGKEARVLEALKEALPHFGYVPVVFDFEEPEDRDTIETVAILAGMASFVIANLTDPRSTPLESQLIIPTIAVPFVPIVRQNKRAFSMFTALQRKYPWVLPTVRYSSEAALVKKLRKAVIEPAQRQARKLRRAKHPPTASSPPARRRPGGGPTR